MVDALYNYGGMRGPGFQGRDFGTTFRAIMGTEEDADMSNDQIAAVLNEAADRFGRKRP